MGKIDKSKIFDVSSVQQGANEIIAEFERIAKSAAENGKKIKGGEGFKDLFGATGETKKLITDFNTTVKTLKTTIDELTVSINKGTKSKNKDSAATKEQTRQENANTKAKAKNDAKTNQLNKDTQKLNATTNAYNANLRKQATGSRGLLGSLKSLTLSLRNLAVAYFGFQTLMRGFQDIFKVTKILDSITFAQEKVIKSQREFGQTQQWLSQIIGDYGLDLVTVTNRYTKFRAATISSNLTAEQTQKIFGSMSKAAATLGLKTDELQGVYLALEQMISKNKVTTEELRRQLGERLPGAFDIMARSMGVSTNKLNDMLKAGEVMSEEVLPNFAIAVEKAYGIQSVKFVDTLVAAQNRLKTSWIELIKILDGADFFKDTINSFASAIKWIGDNIVLIAKLGKAVINLTAIYVAYLAIKRFTMVATLKEITASNLLAATQLRLASATLIVKNAVKALNTAWKANPIGLIITGLLTLSAILLPFIRRKKKATEEVKDFNKEVDEESKKLTVLFASLKTATKGTKEWDSARGEINKEYGAYIQHIIDEKTTVDELNESYKQLIILTRSQIAERRKAEEVNKATNDILSAEIEFKERIEKQQKIDIALGKLSTFEAKQQLNAQMDLARAIADGTELRAIESKEMLTLVNAYQLFDVRIGKAKDKYDEWIKVFGAENVFDPEELERLLDAAEKEFGDFTGIISQDLKDYFADKSDFLTDDIRAEEAYLNGLLVKYKDNKDARIIIEQRLSEVLDKINKKSANEALKIQEEKDKITLKNMETTFEAERALFSDKLTAEGATQEERNKKLLFFDFQNKQALLEEEIRLAENRKLIKSNDAKDILKIEEKIASAELKIAQNTSDNKEDIAKIGIDNLEQRAEEAQAFEQNLTNESILDAEKAFEIEMNLLNKQIRDREITEEQYRDRVRDAERKLHDDIIKLQIKGLKEELTILNLKPEEYDRINEQILQLEGALSESSVEKGKETTDELIEQRKQVRDASIEAINEAFNFGSSILDRQLTMAEQQRDWEVALAGNSLENKLIAERKFERESLKLKKKMAIADKAQAAFNIITNTAVGIMKALSETNIPLSIIIGAIGALQLATVLAEPIPQFFEGGETSGGLAIVGEDKGSKKGGSELITLPSGDSFLSPDSATLMDLPSGTHIDSHSETQRILANATTKTAYEGVSMSRSEGYLKEIRDKGTIERKDGYKIVTRKGFYGKYRTN